MHPLDDCSGAGGSGTLQHLQDMAATAAVGVEVDTMMSVAVEQMEDGTLPMQQTTNEAVMMIEEAEEGGEDGDDDDPFLADPFLALQNDLDDVSEVIKHNLVADQRSLAASSGTCSPSPPLLLAPLSASGSSGDSQQQAKLEMSSPTAATVTASRDASLPREEFDDPGKEQQIGQIVHLLQQADAENGQQQQAQQMTSTSSPMQQARQQRQHPFEQLELSPIGSCQANKRGAGGLLLRYPFGQQGQQQLDPMIGGFIGHGSGSTSPEEVQHYFLQRTTTDFGLQQAELFSDLCPPEEMTVDPHQSLQPYLLEDDSQWAHQQQQCQQSQPMNGLLMESSPPPVEPESRGIIKQELSPQQQQQQQQEQQREAGAVDSATMAKNELIRMLLEMSPEELEHLRSSRARPAHQVHVEHQQPLAMGHHQPVFQQSQPIFIQTSAGVPPPPLPSHMFVGQQQQSPPLDPPPPSLPQFQMDFQQHQQQLPQQQFLVCSQGVNGQQQQFFDYGMQMQPQQVVHQQQQLVHGGGVAQHFFYPSPTGSAALTSPISNGGFPSLAPSEFLDEEDGENELDEMWTDGEGEGGGTNGSGGGSDGLEEQQTMANRGPGRKKSHKTKRRTAHNLIEKKYRCSINDRINQLKEMLATEEGTKLSKSATLRRAVDHICALRNKNSDLSSENGRLRHALEVAGLKAPAPQHQQRETMRMLKHAESHHHHHSHGHHGIGGQQQQLQAGNNNNSTGNGMGKNPRGRAPTIRSSKSGPAQQPAGGGGQGQAHRGDQSRVTLCVFMFLLLAFNPLALFMAGDAGAEEEAQQQMAAVGNHRTLASDDRFDASQFGQDSAFAPSTGQEFPANPASASASSSSSGTLFWLWQPWLRHTLCWLLNAGFVFAILNRLLVSGEPVADRRSPRWDAFVQSRRKTGQEVAAGNWKEAQRQLDESLQLLDRPLPSAGGVDEWMSLTWQIIRHLLNVLWIGRWFARRRRPSVQSQKSVCRSHAATAMVYHQLHQLHLLGVDGIGLTQSGALNTALLAANLAESAGSSAISHALRAEIYACAGIRCRLCLPRWLRRIISGYFFRRAKRHVSKSHRLEGTELNSLQWLFHPLARRFLGEPGRMAAILGASGAQRTPNFPFSESAQAPKPVEVLRDAFKMHLLDRLLFQLDSAEGRSLRVADFVEQSQLLLQICTADSGWKNDRHQQQQDAQDLLSPNGSVGDEICTWWTHLLSGALHWRHGDLARARQHCAVVRKCPRGLGQNDLALAVGLAFCSRKICLEDRQRAAWAEMVLLHTQRSFAHLRRAIRSCQWREMGESGQGTEQIQRRFRLLCCQWLLSSLLDLCSFSIGPERLVPLEVRRLYSAMLCYLEREGAELMEAKKLAMFKQLGQTLCGADPLEGDSSDAQMDRLMATPSPAPSSVSGFTAFNSSTTPGRIVGGTASINNNEKS